MKRSLFHPRLWDVLDYGLGCYPIKTKYKRMRRKSEYTFKRWNHMHLSNRR